MSSDPIISSLARLRRDPFGWVAGGCFVLAAIPYVAPVWSADMQFAYGSLYAPLPFHLLTLVAALIAAKRQVSPQARRFWLLIAAATTCWVGNKALDIAWGAATIPSPIELVSDVLFVGFYLFIALSIEQEPHRRTRPERLMLLRRVGVAVAAFSLLVYFAVLPAALNVEAYLSWLPSLLLYLVLDVYLLGRFVLLSRDEAASTWRGVYLFLALTAALWLANDSLEALAVGGVVDLPPPGHPIDGVFFLKYFTLIAAARLGAMTGEPPHVPADAVGEPLSVGHWGGPLAASFVGLPVLHYGLYAVGWLDEGTRSAREAWMALSLVVFTIGCMVYYRRLVEENRRLWIQSQAAIGRLQASERLEALGRLAGGIAHDFNNVLTVIMGNTDLARDSTTPTDPATHQHLASVTRAAESGAGLVKKLLGFGRRDLVDAKPADLADFTRRVASEWSRLMPDNVTLQFHGSPDTPAVLIDASVFESVVVNLLTNARDSMPVVGRVDIETRTEVVTAGSLRPGVQPGHYGCLEVRDAGVGMDHETLGRVFEPFFTTKPIGEGAGMGLSMAYGIVKQHGGLIEVDSEPGRGTVVTILLPVSDETLAPVQMDSREPPSIGAPGTETILLVEDEDAVRAMAATILESHGFTVLQARDGVEALEVFRGREPIDLVLSDMVMPRMGGVELLEQIRGVPSDVPFIFVSGYASGGKGGEEYHSSVPFVAKPWRSQTLVAEVRRVLDAAKRPASGARH